MFLGGAVLFEQHRAAAARATAALALHLLPAGPVTVEEAVAVLMTGPGGVRHKDHLGYTDEPRSSPSSAKASNDSGSPASSRRRTAAAGDRPHPKPQRHQ